MPDFVGAVDQGTTSTRFMIFDHSGNEVGIVASRFGAIVETQKSAASTPVPVLPDVGSDHAYSTTIFGCAGSSRMAVAL